MASATAQCAFYVKAKQRYCKFPAAGDHGFCYTHAPVQQGVRIPCPMDPSHCIYASKLKSHLLCCTRVRDVASELLQPFVSQNINADVNTALSSSSLPLVDITARPLPPSSSTYDDYVTATLNKNGSPDVPLHDSSDTSLPQNDPLALEALHTTVDLVYQECCRYLSVEPEYFLRGFDAAGTNDNLIGKKVNGKFLLKDILSKDKVVSQLWDTHGEILRPTVASLTRQQETFLPTANDASLLNAPCEPLVSKHDLQNLMLLAMAMQLRPSLTQKVDSLNPILCVEFGAGRGALTRWFAAHLQATPAPRYVLIDREKRRNVAEAKSETGCIDRSLFDIRALRLRVNIRDFDLTHLLTYMIKKSSTEITGPPLPPTLSSTSTPLLLSYLALQINASCQRHSQEATHRLLSGSLDRDDSTCFRETLEFFVKKTGQCRLKALYHRVAREFSSYALAQECLASKPRALGLSPNLPISSEMVCLCVAKHLCGDATDTALRCIINGLLGYARIEQKERLIGSCCFQIIIATCCHHRISWSTFSGWHWLTSRFGLTAEQFHLWLKYSGWATGAQGLQQLIGVKIKRIIDTARVAWLRDAGFPNATLRTFVTPGHWSTLENTVIVTSSPC